MCECLSKKSVFKSLKCNSPRFVCTGGGCNAKQSGLESIQEIRNRNLLMPTKTQRFAFYTVLSFALGILICLVTIMVRIVPEVEKVFIDFDAVLPVMTLIVIMASRFFVRYWWLMALLTFPLFLWLLSASRNASANTLNLLSLLLGVFTIVGILVVTCILFTLLRPLVVLITDLSA